MRPLTFALFAPFACVMVALPACFGSSSSSSDAGANFEGGLGPDAFAGDSSSPLDASADAPRDAQADSGSAEAATDGGNSAAAGIYVTNPGNAVTVFALGATGNTAPIRTLTGASTQLSLPIGVAVNAAGDLLVANRQGGNVTVYAPGAGGDAAPTATLTATGMGSPQGLALGTGGDLYVSACPTCGPANGGTTGVFHFPASFGASDASFTASGVTAPGSIALDASGNVWVANAFGGDVERFAPGTTGTATPGASFTPGGVSNAQSMAQALGVLFVTDPTSGVELFPTTATGSATPSATLGMSAELPLSYPGGVFVDTVSSPPTVYLVDYGASAVYVITTSGTAPDLAVASVATLSGSATGLSSPLDIVVVH